MNSLFFWIIILSFLIPMAMRYYKRSMRGRNQNQGMPGGPDQFGQFGPFPGGQSGYGPGPYPGTQNKQPRDGMTQRDYFGAFGELGAPRQPMPPANQQYPGQPYPNQPYPGQQYPVPYEDSPDYPGNQPRPSSQPFPQQDTPQFGTQQSSTPPPSGPAVPLPPAAPQGFRARKLAELDQRYSDGDLTMEDYMAQRAEIMKG